MKTIDRGIQFRADQANRVAVTAQWLWDNPDTNAYIFDPEADDCGLDPWVTIVGVDALVDGSKIILETGRVGERLVDPDDLVFVRRQRTVADLYGRPSESLSFELRKYP